MPLQQTWLPGQSPVKVPQVHWPLMQLSPLEQTAPQAPQLAGSAVVFTQTPLQSACPA
jgi:hypothetical protein